MRLAQQSLQESFLKPCPPVKREQTRVAWELTIIDHRQSKEWTGNVGKNVNVAVATSVLRHDTLYFGTL